jgi:hypothetical protein
MKSYGALIPLIIPFVWAAWVIIRGRIPARGRGREIARRREPLAYWVILSIVLAVGIYLLFLNIHPFTGAH